MKRNGRLRVQALGLANALHMQWGRYLDRQVDWGISGGRAIDWVLGTWVVGGTVR